MFNTDEPGEFLDSRAAFAKAEAIGNDHERFIMVVSQGRQRTASGEAWGHLMKKLLHLFKENFSPLAAETQ